MTDATTTMSMLEEHELFTIEKMLDEYSDADNTIPKIAWVRLLSDYRTLQSRIAKLEAENERIKEDLAVQVVKSHRTLQSRLDQAHWDAISRDQTIESLRAENARYREALEFYAAHGGERARAALGEEVTS